DSYTSPPPPSYYTAPGQPPYSQPAYSQPAYGQPPAYAQSAPPPQYSAPPQFNPPPGIPAGAANAFGPGYVPSGAIPASPAVAQPNIGTGVLPPPPGDVPYQVIPGDDGRVDLNVNAAETLTGRLMIGAGINSDAGLVGNFVLDEQNFDITRLPRSWEDIRNGT